MVPAINAISSNRKALFATQSSSSTPAITRSSLFSITPEAPEFLEPIEPVSSSIVRLSESVAEQVQIDAMVTLVEVPDDELGASLNGYLSNKSEETQEPPLDACVAPLAPALPKASEDETFQVHVGEQLVAEFNAPGPAEQFIENIEEWLGSTHADPNGLQPRQVDGETIIWAGDRVLLSLNHSDFPSGESGAAWVAIAWTNNLRQSLGAEALPLSEAQAYVENLEPTSQVLGGVASWYGPYFHGRLTASGERFNQEALTAAHPSLPFNTYLKVTNLKNGKTVVVRINDRGPYIGRRSLDLSRRAAECLGSEHVGVVPYEATILNPQPNTLIQTALRDESPSEEQDSV